MGSVTTAQINIKTNLDVSQAKGQINSLQAAFSKLNLPKGMENSFNKTFAKMKNDVSQIEALMQKGLTSKADVNSFNKLTNEVDKSYSKILTMINQINGKEVSVKVDTTKLKNLESELQKAQQEYQNILKNSFASSGKDTFGGMLNSISQVSTSSKTLKANLESVKGALQVGDFTAVKEAVNSLVSGFSKLGASTKGKLVDTLGLNDLKLKINETETSLKELFNNWGSLDAKTKGQAMELFNKGALESLVSLMNNLETETTEATTKMNGLNESIALEKSSSISKAQVELKKLARTAEQSAQAQKKASQEAQQGVMYQYDKQMQVNDLRMQVQYFFGLQNMIRLFRKGVSDAISTVKELDKAMTATAVVTDYSVGDMWGQLPEYTKRAQQLGTTIADMYNATTLYYQQGLDTEHAMGTAVETLKMARIAGIEGAEATDLMTAALRGFRMESNEANASHVNDVYSALAASSASNTYEIGTAMSKVASLASSANMDLETTATFLAQIIETTREAPETAGTALKTIIARFGEVKKLGENGLLTGTDEEGEVIDINKVDTALKTAGISLQDFINGNEGLDQVFLRLAERWGTLSVAQQRYIATQAAGARMQARFIAMMQDYGRTQELLGIATNAEGAGEKQFGKVTESLEYKLNQLKDAYHSFVMGIANSSAIKGVVDVLTTGFNAVNSIIQKVSGTVGNLNKGLGDVVKTALSIGTAFAALKIGGKVLNTGVNAIGGLVLGKGAMAAGKTAGMNGAFGGIMGAKTSAITAPIVSRLDTLIGLSKIGNKINSTNSANKGETLTGRGFLAARRGINSLIGGKDGATTNVLMDQMSQYSSETQRAIMATSPGTSQAIKSSFYQGVKKLDLKTPGQIAARSFINAQEKAFKTGKVDFTSYVKSASMASSKAFSQHMLNANDRINQFNLLGAKNLQTDADAAEWIRQRAISARAKEIFQDKKAYQSFDKARMEGKDSGIPKSYLKGEYNKARAQAMQEMGQLGENPIKLTGLEKAGNTVASLGAGIASAGMALNAFSANLSSMGADRAAAAVSALGSAFTTVGMAASSAGSILSGVSNIATMLGTSASVVGGVFAGIGVLVAGIVAAYKLHQHNIKKIRDEGKQVTKDYQKNVVEQKKSIKELSDGYKEYQQLRKGVDSKGNNISLDEEQYKRYQDYTDKLISMNGALQQGVNNTGQAYVSQYADIQKALKEASKDAERSEEQYLTNGSGQSIIDQVKTYKRINKLMGKPGQQGSAGAITRTGRVPRAANRGTTPTEIEKQATTIETSLQEITGYQSQLQELGLGDIDFGNLNVADAKKIYDKADALSSYIESSDLDDKAKASAEKAISKLTKTYDSAVEAAKPQTDWLEKYLDSTNMSGAALEKKIADKFDFKKLKNKTADSHLAELGKEQALSLTGSFREGLETLSLTGLEQGWDAETFKTKATDYARSLEELTGSAGKGKEYSTALEGIAKAQAEFDKAIEKNKSPEEAAATYRASIIDQIGTLNSLEAAYREAAANGDIGAGLIADGIHEGMLKAVMYTEEGEQRIAESINGLSNSFNSANSALENYQEKTKDLKDYYTAAEGMKEILTDIGYDEEKGTFSGKDVEGKGSQKFWLAAENLVDEKVLDQGIDKVKSKMSQIAPMLKEGQEGYNNFISSLHQHYANKDLPGLEKFYSEDGKGGFKIDVDDSSLGKMADLLGVSDDLLSSMLNKSRQFMDWDLSNIDQLSSSIKTSEETLGGKGKYFYNYDQLRADARAAGVTDFGKDSEFQKIVTDLQSKGIKLLNVDELMNGDKTQRAAQGKIAKELTQSLGFTKQAKSLDDIKKYIEPFAKSGQYNAEETLSILKSSGLIKGEQSEETAMQAWEELNSSPELTSMNETAANTAQANSYLAQIVAASGQIPKEISEGVGNLHKEVMGEKGIDTKYQYYGHEQNEQGKLLSYNERREGLTAIDTKINEAKEYQKTLETALSNATSDTAKKEIQKQIKTNQETLNYLNDWKAVGSTGITTAEKLLDGNAENFDYSAFGGEKNRKGLQALDEILRKAEKIDFKTLGSALRSEETEGMERGAKSSILGQYSLQEMKNAGITIPKNVTSGSLGSLLNIANNPNLSVEQGIEQFATQVNNAFKGVEGAGPVIASLKDQFAQMEQMDFFSPAFWDFSQKMGTIDSAKIQEIIGRDGNFQIELDTVAKMDGAEQIQQTLANISSDADKIKVIDSFFKLNQDPANTTAIDTIHEITGLSTEEIMAMVKFKSDNTEVEEDKEKNKENTSNTHKTKSDNSEVEEDKEKNKENTSSEHEITANDTEVQEAKAEAEEPTESPVTFTFENGTNPLTTNPFASTNGEGSSVKVDTIFEPKTEQVDEKKESIKTPEPEVKVNFTVGKDSVSKKKKAYSKPIEQTVVKKQSTTITAKANTGAATTAINNAAKNRNSTITVGADTSQAISKANTAASTISSLNPTITIGGAVASSFNTAAAKIQAKIDELKALKVWTGRNNHRMGAYSTGYNQSSLNSYASGKKRTTKGNTVPALTGEIGPELAWYPKEGRAELLGVGGPQFVPDLPKDSVVWNARQTEQIMKRKSIPLNSFSEGTGTIPGSGGGGGRGGGGGKQPPKQGQTPPKKDKQVEQIVQNTGTISRMDVGIYNLTKKIEITSSKIEKNSDVIKKKLSDTIDFSYSQINSLVGDQSKLLTRSSNQNKELAAQYQKLLTNLNAGKGKYKNYEVSWEKNVKDKNGKKTTKTQKTKVNLGTIIVPNGEGGYKIDYNKINKIAQNKKQGKKFADAVLEAAKKELDDLTSKKISADKAKLDADNKLADLRKELKETLYGWEDHLTRIKNLEDKISLSESFANKVESIQKLITNMVDSSLSNLAETSNDYLKAINASVAATTYQINKDKDLWDAYKQQLADDLTLQDEYTKQKEAKDAYDQAKKDKKDQGTLERLLALYNQRKDETDRAQVGKRYVQTTHDEHGQIQVTFDRYQFEKDKNAGDINATEAKAVQDYYDKILDDINKLQDVESSIADKINSLYDQRNEQYQMMSDYTQKIRDGMEDEEQKTIDNLSDLNKSIQDAFKDLIDKVKKELDKQRKAEQNQKDEENITNKMNRLAMLRADTAGGNAAEIARLEKEIGEDTGKYEDSLEDQLLDRLQDQADEAAKQREKQIELLTAQLNYSKTTGIYLARAENLVQRIANGDTSPQTQQLARLYYLGSTEMLDKWGKKLESINFASETLKVANFNESVATFEKAIKDFQDEAKKLINTVFNSRDAYDSLSLRTLKNEIKSNRSTINIEDAKTRFRNEGGQDENDAFKSLKEVGYSVKDFHKAGYSASQAKAAGFSAKALKGTYTGKQIHDAKYTAKQFRAAGYNAKQAKKSGYSVKELKSGGYTLKNFKENGLSAKNALDAGFKRASVVKTYSAAKVRAVDAGTKKTATLDTNGKEKGGAIKSGTVNKAGTRIAAQKGDTVYAQDYNVKTGKGTGKTLAIKFGGKGFNTKFIKNNQKEAGKELAWQLRNNSVGSKIHKDWAKFIAASTYSPLKAGKEVQLKGRKGTITNKGKLYYNTSKGIEAWDPSTGKTGIHEKWKDKKTSYSKFKKKAKLTGLGREYTHFLLDKKLFKAKGGKIYEVGKNGKITGNPLKFATGGLADYTGPAWMDGTPSKPELVLNPSETKNFLALKDVLADATKRGIFNHDQYTSSGDINLDIDINVDKIDSDYDVDQVADRVKKIIVKEAKYRNVTVTGRSR